MARPKGPRSIKPINSVDVPLELYLTMRFPKYSASHKLPELSKAMALGPSSPGTKVLWAPSGVILKMLPLTNSATNKFPALTASLGFEPRQRDPESLVLPLHHEAIWAESKPQNPLVSSGSQNNRLAENQLTAFLGRFDRD